MNSDVPRRWLEETTKSSGASFNKHKIEALQFKPLQYFPNVLKLYLKMFQK